jgi:DNA polymerase I
VPERNDTEVVLFGRSAEDPTETYEVVCQGFRPYFYAPAAEVRADETYILEEDTVTEIDYDVPYDSFIEDTELAKIYTRKPNDVPAVADQFSKSWNADVPYTNRFRIDRDIEAYAEVPEPDGNSTEIKCDYREVSGTTPTPQASETGLQNVGPRVCTLDIEVDDRGDGFPQHGEERILSIVAHDNFTDETHAFIDLEERPVEKTLGSEAPDEVDAVHYQSSEKKMLIDFRSWFTNTDPDIVTGWNADDFDIPFILERFDAVRGLNPNALSRMGWAGVTSRGEPRIKGRTVYDLLDVYKANSFTELDSYRLDDVAKEELGAEKIEFDGTYYELYQDQPRKFLEYNARDVALTVGINETAGVIEFRDVLRREVGVDFEDSYNANDFIEMMCRRKLRERGEVGPTAEYAGQSDYEGAYVFDAYEGVAESVVGIDLASLYPYTMAMLNASPETYVEDASAEDELYEADNGAHFEPGDHGLFAELVDSAIGLKAEYKKKRDNAETDEEYEKWAQKYASAKTITNSIYGVTGWERFFLYHEPVAEAVTLTGQAVIKETAKTVAENGYEVIYGDTDSTYIKFPDHWDREHCLDTAESLCETLNDYVYPGLAEERNIPAGDNLWEIEVEAYMKRFFQAGKKKRYAYLATWKDGREVENPKPSISGFSSKRSDSSTLTEETEKEVLSAILHGEQDKAREIVYEAAQEIEPKAPNWERIGIPGGMNKKITGDPELGERDEYYAVSNNADVPQDAHPRAVFNSNNLLGLGIGSADKPMRVYIEAQSFEELGRTIDVLAFETNSDMEPIEDEIAVDVQRMLEVTLLNPLGKILSAIDMDITAVIRGQEQTGLGAFKQ